MERKIIENSDIPNLNLEVERLQQELKEAKRERDYFRSIIIKINLEMAKPI